MCIFCVYWQNSGKLEKAEILEMTVQYLRALHSADFPRGREKGKSMPQLSSTFYACKLRLSVDKPSHSFFAIDDKLVKINVYFTPVGV